MSETEFVETAEKAARLAGEVLQEWSQRFTVSEKRPADLVTDADFASQQAIFETIQQRFPDHRFLGEEGLSVTESDSPYRWIIDPLDGTTNYVHHFPYYAVSIALEYDGDLLVGVVFDPNRDELFCARRGGGATLNGQSISPTSTVQLPEAMVIASLPVRSSPESRPVQEFLRVMTQVQTIQRTGSAALNLAYVAAGRIDAFWSSSLKPWDMAAGALLVTEAGGRVSRKDGRPLEIAVPDILTSNGPELHEQLQQLLT